MPPKPKGRGNGKPVRRSGRASKHKTFGSDFEMDDPPRKRARKEPEPDPPSTDPKPGTSSDPVPDPDPSSPKKLKWDSDPEHWRQPMLPTNHSKRCLSFVAESIFSEAPFVSGSRQGSIKHGGKVFGKWQIDFIRDDREFGKRPW